MGRPPGSRNRDYDATRHALAAGLAGDLVRDDGEPATFRDLAERAGVSGPTLRHYFGDRDGVYVAAMEAVAADSRGYLEALRHPAADAPDEDLRALVVDTVVAWRQFALGRVFSGALALGLHHETRGPSFLDAVLEPFLQAGEGLIEHHVRRGTLPPVDTRAAALGLVGPVVLALLHQDALGGTSVRPLDVEAFAARHAATMLAGLRSGATDPAADEPGS